MIRNILILLLSLIAASAQEMSFSFSPEGHQSSSSSSAGADSCGLCSRNNLSACTSWVTSLDYTNYNVRNLFCGCTDRITGDSQCFRFMDRGLSELESFAKNKCGVHLRCEILDYDAEPDSHVCDEQCAVLFMGCFAKCSTTCAYLYSCQAIAPVGK
ncbi:hypothetical protein FisN_15Hh343 [Fistulifera solaris]|uniref:Folate receptor-like domain-containing protein n=1 Tax=Fistulifera solaris TaxID=1519565 RepID=A0A1Z5JFV1_FISSO|nr:hypothetical protein FisN_15Hh343 [Fistulifera solaris]|eukprot:GAX12859.1 hypothetical protein FisN_15Hh343 [Fistulifera solaris]